MISVQSPLPFSSMDGLNDLQPCLSIHDLLLQMLAISSEKHSGYEIIRPACQEGTQKLPALWIFPINVTYSPRSIFQKTGCTVARCPEVLGKLGAVLLPPVQRKTLPHWVGRVSVIRSRLQATFQHGSWGSTASVKGVVQLPGLYFPKE